MSWNPKVWCRYSSQQLHRFADWLDKLHFTRIFSAASSFLLLLTLIGFYIDIEDREQQRKVNAWQLITVIAPGNSGKIDALEYLYSIDEDLVGLNLSIPIIKDSHNRYDQLPGVYLRGIRLPNANLSGSKFRQADLTFADLSGANLFNADLSLAFLNYANLRNANLQLVNFQGAHLEGADLRGATIVIRAEGPQAACIRLQASNDWKSAYRDPELACGAAIPHPPKN
ncbi:pentapeptide repeat-containing protein [Parasalinivibrio latis]|uniref:pentapeptide repeat-containing protein n=1 Tax=Parasalinivibrio latis TaxID=2952610 RepID=UPI0030DFEA8F